MLLNCGVGEDSWTARRSNQSVLKEISLEYSLEGLMLKPKLQYFGHLMRRANLKRPWCWERLRAGEGDDRGWDGWMASAIRWTCVWVNSGSWWWTGRPGVLQSMGSQRVEHDWETELNWFSLKKKKKKESWALEENLETWRRKKNYSYCLDQETLLQFYCLPFQSFLSANLCAHPL